jgi:hypothetical protein
MQCGEWGLYDNSTDTIVTEACMYKYVLYRSSQKEEQMMFSAGSILHVLALYLSLFAAERDFY